MPHNEKVTISHVAQVANVSRMTVSRVLNNRPGVSDTTRQRILDTISSLGYVANSAARTLRGDSHVLGLIVPGMKSSYIGAIVAGVSTAAERLDYSLMLYTQGVSEHAVRSNHYTAVLRNGLVDGVLMVVPFDYDVLVNACIEQGMPYAIIDHHGNTVDELAITATNRKGILDAMRHLLALGHQHIGFITGRMTLRCSIDRLQGYKDALTEVGLPYDAQLVCEGDYEQLSGFRQAQKLLQLDPRPTAIMASNDVMAFGVMDAIKEAGLRIPKDISVIGFDDIPMAAQVYPPLTTVRQPMSAMGETAVDLLVTLLRGHTPHTLRLELATELVIRESTARARPAI